MAQAVLNNLNNMNITNYTSSEQTVGKGFDSSSKTDFEKLFEKQSAAQKMSNNKNAEPEEVVKDSGYTLGDVKDAAKINNKQDKISAPKQEEISKELALSEEVKAALDGIEAAEEDTESIEQEELTENSDETNTSEEEETMEIKDNISVTLPYGSEMTQLSQPIEQRQEIEDSDASANEEQTDDLKVTLNGKDLDSALESLSQELPADETIQVPKTENSEEGAKTLEDIVDEDMLEELNVESVETETSSDEGASPDLMQNQTPEEYGVKAMLQIDVGYTTDAGADTSNQVNNVQTAPKASSTPDVNPSKILDQISKQLEGLYNNSKVNIVLNPESLGKITIQLLNTEDGLSAQFIATTQDAKNLLMKGVDGLKDTLMSHGVNVDNVTVKMNDTQESEYNPDWTEQEGSRGGNKEQNPQRERQDNEQFERMMSFVQDENGNV